jgi:gas vesicle protein
MNDYQKSNDTQKSIVSFIIGAAAGVAAGLLLAPYSGQDTRKRLSDKATDIKNKVGSQLGDTLDKVSNYADTTLNNLSGKAKDVAEQVTDKINNVTSNTAGTSNTNRPNQY